MTEAKPYAEFVLRLDNKSRMSREVHVRFREGVGVQLPRATRLVILVQGKKEEAQARKDEIRKKLQTMGLALSEEKTKLTHWRHLVHFLGYQIHGRPTRKGTSIKPILSIPHEKLKGIKEDLATISGHHAIPEMDALVQMSVKFRGWCNYYRYATAPQPTFSNLSGHTWWCYAHYVARKHRLSIARMIEREKAAGRLGVVKRDGRNRSTFQIPGNSKTWILDLFPPRTGQIHSLATNGKWTGDLKPVNPQNWQSGRSLATRTAAWERANGICERCGEKPAEHVHHTVPHRKKTRKARVASDSAQRYTAVALCKECHLDAHGGSYSPRKRKSQVG